MQNEIFQDWGKDLFKTLVETGISKPAARLYLLSLQKGPGTISSIAGDLKMSRPSVYKLIQELQKFQLVDSSYKRYQRTFMVSSPSVISELLEQKVNKVEEIQTTFTSRLSNLLEQYQQGNVPSKFRLIEGEGNFVKLFFQILDEEKETIEYCGSAADFIGFISWKEDIRWIKKRKKLGVRLRTLLLPSEDARILQKNDSKELRETRFLIDFKPFVTSFQLFANKVILWQPKARIALLIEDEFIVQMMRSLFDYCWKKAK